MRILLLFILIALMSSNLFADGDAANPNLTVGSSSQGYDFLIAFPPNEVAAWTTGELAIYVSSLKPTVVELRDGVTNQLIATKNINQANSLISFNNQNGELNISRDEIRASETAVNQTFRIVSSVSPVSVYVLNSKITTSDGYMAIPISYWGNEYIHCSYYDKSEGSNDSGNPYFGGGFVVLASEDNTVVKIHLRGRGGSFSSTLGGKRIGDTFSVTLNKGQAYMVKGKGETIGSFDLTGSKISADKPIALLSFHQRTDIPALIGSTRDHLIEMLPPVSAWGKTYSTIELKRIGGKGDLFRIVASESNTNYEVKWYDMDTDLLMGSKSGTLVNAGDFVEISDKLQAPSPTENSITGVSVFKADKPILVMHYSYSSAWDGDTNYDPFMILTSSVDQFTKATVFQIPAKFGDNWFNLIAIGDPDDNINHSRLLESITLDGNSVYTIAPQFKYNRIPGTNLYWARLQVIPGPHIIKGDTRFGGYVYGFDAVDSYGWPAAMAINDNVSQDMMKPVVSVNNLNSTSYVVNYIEDPNLNNIGVTQKPTLLPQSYNFNEVNFDNEFKSFPPNHYGDFTLSVKNKSLDAVAYFSVKDKAGNERIDSIKYVAGNLPKLKLTEPAQGAVGVSRQPEFLWEADGSKYDLYLSPQLSGVKTNIPFISNANSYNSKTKLKPGTTYYWMVESVDGNTTASDIWQFTVTEEIEQVVLVEPANKSINVELNPYFFWFNVEVEKYKIEISTKSDMSDALVYNKLSNSHTLLQNLAENTKYYWRVTAIDGQYSSVSNIHEFTTKQISSVEEESQKETMRLFPSPANEFISVEFADDMEILNAKIVSVKGETLRLLSSSELKTKIDIMQMPAGTYILAVQTEQGQLSRKFTIVR